jgi:hypothetical protein
LIPVLFITIYPVPAWPYNITPYVFLAILVAGFGYMRWLVTHKPAALDRGATMLIGSSIDSIGDVDWDAPGTDASLAGGEPQR